MVMGGIFHFRITVEIETIIFIDYIIIIYF